MNTQSSLNQQDISNRAREIWEQSGRPEGRELEHWLQAERELAQAAASAASPTRGKMRSMTPFTATASR